MLIGTFQVECRGPVEIIAVFKHEGVSRAGFEPHIDDVVDLVVVGGVIVVAEKDLRIGGVPDIGASRLEGLGDAVEHRLIAQ